MLGMFISGVILALIALAGFAFGLICLIKGNKAKDKQKMNGKTILGVFLTIFAGMTALPTSTFFIIVPLGRLTYPTKYVEKPRVVVDVKSSETPAFTVGGKKYVPTSLAYLESDFLLPQNAAFSYVSDDPFERIYSFNYYEFPNASSYKLYGTYGMGRTLFAEESETEAIENYFRGVLDEIVYYDPEENGSRQLSTSFVEYYNSFKGDIFDGETFTAKGASTIYPEFFLGQVAFENKVEFLQTAVCEYDGAMCMVIDGERNEYGYFRTPISNNYECTMRKLKSEIYQRMIEDISVE